ncbi:MAG: helix-turn-helix domain-containing protein [Candidatus Saccharibacteria bacterium]
MSSYNASVNRAKSILNHLLSSTAIGEEDRAKVIESRDLLEQVLECEEPMLVNRRHHRLILNLPPMDNRFQKLSIEGIIDSVAYRFGITYEDIIGESRKADVVKARHVAMFLVVDNHVHKTYNEIGIYFRRHHTTIIYGYERVKSLCDDDPTYLIGCVDHLAFLKG